MLLKVAADKSFRRKEKQCNNKMYYSTFFDTSGPMSLCFIGRSVLILHAWQVCTHALYTACVTGAWKFCQYSATQTHTHTHPGKLISFFKSSRDAVRCCLCVLPFMVQDRVCGHGNVIFLWQLLHLLVLSYSVCNTFAFFTSWRSQLLRRAFVFSLLLKVRRWKFKF